jgi:hypothetical protein
MKQVVGRNRLPVMLLVLVSLVAGPGCSKVRPALGLCPQKVCTRRCAGEVVDVPRGCPQPLCVCRPKAEAKPRQRTTE